MGKALAKAEKEKREFDRGVLDLAYSLRDTKFVRNYFALRQILLLRYANPRKSPRIKAVAQEFGVSPKSVRAMVKSKRFQEDLTALFRERIMDPSLIKDAIESFVLAVKEGRRWAVERALEERGVIGSASKGEGNAPAYDRLILNLNLGKEKPGEVIDLKKGEDYDLPGNPPEIAE